MISTSTSHLQHPFTPLASTAHARLIDITTKPRARSTFRPFTDNNHPVVAPIVAIILRQAAQSRLDSFSHLLPRPKDHSSFTAPPTPSNTSLPHSATTSPRAFYSPSPSSSTIPFAPLSGHPSQHHTHPAPWPTPLPFRSNRYTIPSHTTSSSSPPLRSPSALCLTCTITAPLLCTPNHHLPCTIPAPSCK